LLLLLLLLLRRPRAGGMAASAGAGAVGAADVYDVAVVGGGLSGLCVARGLAARGISYALLEASAERLGGRLRNTAGGIDLGAAWVWPAHGQHRVAALLEELGVGTFPQPGNDAGNTRVVGGTAALVDGIVRGLEPDRLMLGWRLESARLADDDGVVVLTSSSIINTDADAQAQPRQIFARYVVMAAPPRKLSDGSVQFSPALPAPRIQAMRRARTWMAGVTKVVVHFPEPFWRRVGGGHDIANMGLSSGPAFQVYDASSFEDSVVALTFFALAPAELSSAADEDHADQALAEACCGQLAAAWRRYRVPAAFSDALIKGCRDAATAHVVAQRWPKAQHISDEEQPTTIHPHPRPVAALAQAEWSGRLHFAGTESDQRSPGVIEGAIGSAHRVLAALNRQEGLRGAAQAGAVEL
jgi:monoamine oxidase